MKEEIKEYYVVAEGRDTLELSGEVSRLYREGYAVSGSMVVATRPTGGWWFLQSMIRVRVDNLKHVPSAIEGRFGAEV